jgi:hypothetical protein
LSEQVGPGPANDIWLAEQAFTPMAPAIETASSVSGVLRGKLAISELKDSSILLISKTIGGASFFRSGPFGQWS